VSSSLGIAIGDVTGHDVSAAAAMGQLRSVLRSYAYEGSSPSVVLDRLDRLVQGFDMAQVATAIFGRLVRDDAGATLLFANAGHLPPILRHRDGSVHRVERGTSPLIGVLAPGVRPRNEATVTVPEGALLVLYTDGLVETRHCWAHSSASTEKTTSRCSPSASTRCPHPPDRAARAGPRGRRRSADGCRAPVRVHHGIRFAWPGYSPCQHGTIPRRESEEAAGPWSPSRPPARPSTS
jgi:hypothetical protein